MTKIGFTVDFNLLLNGPLPPSLSLSLSLSHARTHTHTHTVAQSVCQTKVQLKGEKREAMSGLHPLRSE